jgi:hypothetical protein
MGKRSSKHSASIRNAKKGSRAIKFKIVGGHSGPYGIALDSPTQATNNFKRVPIQATTFKPATTIRDQSIRPSPTPRLSAKDVDFGSTEHKYLGVLEFEKERAKSKHVSNARAAELGEQHGLSGNYLRKLANEAGTRSFMRKMGSGQKKTVANREDIILFMEQKALEWDYEFTQRAMEQEVREKFGVGCLGTIQNMMYGQEWKKGKKYVKPFLTDEHKQARLNWAEERVQFDFFSSDKVVHIDEKYFYAFKTGKIIYYPKGCEPPATTALSKTQIPKVMFLGAVAPPNEAKKFDGMIGLWMVGGTKVAGRNSKFHDRGDEYEVPVMMNGELFVSMGKELLLPAISKKLKWAKSVEVQMDSAGGHKIDTSVDALNVYCRHYYPKVSFITQPTRSPDMNVLDLGIWNSLQSGVPSIKYDKGATEQMYVRIVNEVMRAWDTYDGMTKLTKIFTTLTMIYNSAIMYNGGNNFKLPHSLNQKK